MELKHTAFMDEIANQIGAHLPPPYAESYRIGERRWICQIYFGEDKALHYEVARSYSVQGRWLEVGLHFESRNPATNLMLLRGFDQHLFQLQEALGGRVYADMWDKGWTKVYELHPDDLLTPEYLHFTLERLARFIGAAQPIFESLMGENHVSTP